MAAVLHYLETTEAGAFVLWMLVIAGILIELAVT